MQDNDGLKVMTPLSERLAELLTTISKLRDQPDVEVFKCLLDTLRERADDEATANQHMDILLRLLKGKPSWAEGLCVFILTLISQYRQVSLYTDMGILSDTSFLSQFHALVGSRLLPPTPDSQDLTYLFHVLFATPQTRQWVTLVDDRKWMALVLLLRLPKSSPHKKSNQHKILINELKSHVLKAITILAHRISGIGLHPDMLKAFPNPTENQETFIELNQEVRDFIQQYQANYLTASEDTQLPLPEVDSSQIFVLTDQAEQMVLNIRKRIHKTGITIRTTNMLVRLEQTLQRLELLLSLLATDSHTQKSAVITLLKVLYEGSHNRNSFRYLFGVNTELLSRKVTENASKVGEHYISTDKSGYRRMYLKAARGGVLIGFMATLKILGKYLALAPMGVAFLNSMIYGLGFVLIHIIGGTVATKQPAMTAAAIASTISEVTGRNKNTQLSKLAELVVDIMRTQFIAIMGNISIAMPVALLISSFWLYGLGKPLTSLSTADHLLHDLNPFTSLAIPHAAIAGVYLYISGLIAGYYDNLAVHNQIGERIRNHPRLQQWMSTERLQRFSDFVERNLGAIMSNFIFGCFLGSTATIGFMFGLPLDIRHIAFASANFIHGIFNIFANTGEMPELSLILVSLLGVAVIGMINLLVSFSLALITALRARNVKMFEWKYLFGLVYSHLMNQPSDFFVPRKQPMKYALIDSDGNIIYDDKPIEKSKKTAPPPAVPSEPLTPAEKLAQVEKLTPAEIEEKKQAIKDKVADKKPDNVNDTASKLPK
ncbi:MULTISPECIES: site-specific recombinase [unclassified Moraxella]|uniref:site-specific recombinase n=1 Tax=unclassified Moraxella TaxID=2685852 RepID=UPI003AF7514C